MPAARDSTPFVKDLAVFCNFQFLFSFLFFFFWFLFHFTHMQTFEGI